MQKTRSLPVSFPARLVRALPFWVSLAMVPLVWWVAMSGGLSFLWLIAATFGLLSIVDLALGLDPSGLDTDTPENALIWHRLVTLFWPPLQFAMVFGAIWWVTGPGGYTPGEAIGLMASIGVLTGAIGIVYAHELMHQRPRAERFLGDMLMAMVLYGHFRSEHLLVHHRYVGTPRDAVTARRGEGFWAFLARVLPGSLISAWRAEAAMLARRKLPAWHRSNPFWRYGALQAGFLVLAFVVGGGAGLGLFVLQAGVAILHLEAINYLEHYGLTRKHIGEGKYEYTHPRHSWNAAQRMTNWFLINLQRHSDHHFKPDRRYPLLQTHDATEAPQLPFGYGIMLPIALVPPLWRRMMDPRVDRWRAQFYPEITDWSAYDAGATPMPR